MCAFRLHSSTDGRRDERCAGEINEFSSFPPLPSPFRPLADLVSDDFLSYLEAHKMVDEAYVDQESWIEKSSALFLLSLPLPSLNETTLLTTFFS
jgi:hypothetical protein